MTDHPTDLPALLAECEQAYAKMTPGPWWLGTGPHFRVYMNDRDATPLHESWFGHDVYGIVTLVNAYPALRDEIVRLRSLIARVVVVMDGSWDMLPPDEEEALARELRAAALTDAPAPQETTE